jgi:uncharacterized protein YdeI (YjbR/CyaY-like superfamily)
MRPAGEAEFAKRREDRTAIYSSESPIGLDEEATAAINAAGVREFWERQPPGYRRQAAHIIMSAKRPETRAKRLNTMIEAARRGERMF